MSVAGLRPLQQRRVRTAVPESRRSWLHNLCVGRLLWLGRNRQARSGFPESPAWPEDADERLRERRLRSDAVTVSHVYSVPHRRRLSKESIDGFAVTSSPHGYLVSRHGARVSNTPLGAGVRSGQHVRSRARDQRRDCRCSCVRLVQRRRTRGSAHHAFAGRPTYLRAGKHRIANMRRARAKISSDRPRHRRTVPPRGRVCEHLCPDLRR